MDYLIYVDIFILALFVGLGWGARSEYHYAKNLSGKVTNLEAQLAGAKMQLREWEMTCARLSDQVAAYRHTGMTLEEKDKKDAHCHACGLRKLATVRMTNRYRQFCFCDECFDDFVDMAMKLTVMRSNKKMLEELKKDDGH